MSFIDALILVNDQQIDTVDSVKKFCDLKRKTTAHIQKQGIQKYAGQQNISSSKRIESLAFDAISAMNNYIVEEMGGKTRSGRQSDYAELRKLFKEKTEKCSARNSFIPTKKIRVNDIDEQIELALFHQNRVEY